MQYKHTLLVAPLLRRDESLCDCVRASALLQDPPSDYLLKTPHKHCGMIQALWPPKLPTVTGHYTGRVLVFSEQGTQRPQTNMAPSMRVGKIMEARTHLRSIRKISVNSV